MSFVSFTICVAVKYSPRILWVFFLYSRACSSDQKNTHSFQKESMMLGSSSFLKSTCGMNTTGSAPSSRTLQTSSLSSSICIGSEQWAHSVPITTDNDSPLNCPCTKGVANASAAQAP